MVSRLWILAVVIVALGGVGWALRPSPPPPWSQTEIATLRSLWIESLPPLSDDPTNAVADDLRAVTLGQRLFFDTRLSVNREVSCASCHDPDRHFTDGLEKGRGVAESKRNTRSVVGSAYSPWQYWDGRRDSLWSQALSPLEDVAEHGANRLELVRFITRDAAYRRDFEALFGPLPDFSDPGRFPEAASPLAGDSARRNWQAMSERDRDTVNRVFAYVGKAIAAYERRLLPGESRFDRYVAAVIDADEVRQAELFSNAEVRGLRLFTGEARCLDCHNGPLFTNDAFHNTGLLSYPGEVPDVGRVDGVRQALADPFNCRGAYSDAEHSSCPELDFVMQGPELLGAFRTPSLRNLTGTEPFMHKGQLETLEDVLEHYNEAPAAMIGHSELEPLGLGRRERADLEAFLETLAAPVRSP